MPNNSTTAEPCRFRWNGDDHTQCPRCGGTNIDPMPIGWEDKGSALENPKNSTTRMNSETLEPILLRVCRRQDQSGESYRMAARWLLEELAKEGWEISHE